MSAGYRPPTASGQNAEPYSYRNSPSSSHSISHSFSLPPIRDIEAGPAPSQEQLLQHHQQPGHPHQHPLPPPPFAPAHHQFGQPQLAMNSQLPPPPMQMGSQYYPPGQQPLPPPPPHAMHMSQDPNAPVRYPLAPDNRMMSGGRHKKEIKRRTKTGCLTCRKRRIKCDEGHPTCRNCMKSKRDCLGYDPIFKSQPGPTNIPLQPAPNAAPSIAPPPSSASPYPAPPPGYAPVPHPYPAAMPPGTSGPSAGAEHKFDYNTAIDPALEGAGTAHIPANLYDGSHEARLGAKPTIIEELLNVGSGFPPPAIMQIPSMSNDNREEIKSVFLSIYGLGMDKFFETRWFTARGIHHLLADQRLCEKYLALTGRFGITANNNYHENLITQSLEAHVIWDSLLLCRQVSASIVSTNDSNSQVEIDAGVHDAAKRLRAFEALITNQQVDADLPAKIDEFYEPSKAATGLNSQLIDRERGFWKQVAIFSSLKDESEEAVRPDPNVDPAMTGVVGPSGTDTEKIDACLKEMRMLLDSRENRDILYSVAIARVVGQSMANKAIREGVKPEAPAPVTNSEDDPKTKLHVARTFIQGESSGKGTTQVAQRICGMAVRAWGGR